MKHFILIILLLLFSLSCKNQNSKNELVVSCAMSLKGAVEKVGVLYQSKYPDRKILFNFGSSGKMAVQIKMGAPVDVFASAAQKEMNDLEKKGLIVNKTRKNFAENRIVMVSAKGININLKTIDQLTNIKGKIAVGNPGSVPGGRYAKIILLQHKLWNGLKDKLVYCENVRQVLDYVVRKEVDAGFVFYTDYKVHKNKLDKLTIPHKKITGSILYPVAVIEGSTKKKMAEEFIELMVSKQGQAIFNKFGFTGM
jgi:molybdate transport system substrate-binding protein